MHDSLDPFSPEGDRRDLQRLVAKFVRQVDFGKDLEQHLNFLVDCRKAFCNMTGVQEQLVHVCNRLAMEALRLVKGKHSPRTAAFVKACVAFNQITVPSLVRSPRRAAGVLHLLTHVCCACVFVVRRVAVLVTSVA